MSMSTDQTNTLESYISTAELVISNYLKDHADCPKEVLMNQVLNSINTRKNRRKDIVHKTKPIHILAWLIAFKELEKEKLITVNRHDLEFPLIDNRSRFSLKQ